MHQFTETSRKLADFVVIDEELLQLALLMEERVRQALETVL